MNKLFWIITLAALVFSSNSFADEKKTLKATLETATVFFQGAELTHKATTMLNRGDNEIWIENLSPNIDNNSLKIKVTNGAVVTSHEYSIDYLSKKDLSPVEKKLQDSIRIYKKQQRDTGVKLETTEKMIALLDANKSIGGTQNGLSVAELMKMMDYYQGKSNEMENAKRTHEDTQVRLEERITQLENQLNQEAMKNNKSSGLLKLNLTSPTSASANFTISYYTTAAGWTPYYDINVVGTDKPISIASKAKLKQITGMDWSKVKLSLSTSAPSNGKIAPLFKAWFLDFVQVPVLQGRVAGLAVQNSYSYGNLDFMMRKEAKEPQIKIRGVGKNSSAQEPLYVVDGVAMDKENFANIDPNMVKNIEVLKDASATSIYGSRGTNGVVVITLKNSMNDYVARDENQLNMTYNIDLPYTIEGNGKEQSIDLQKYDIAADFQYYCAPKLDTETFLLAEISDWEKLGLLSGKANITYDGTYVGETFIDAASTQNKLSLTLGSDKRVAVKREKLQDYSSKKFLGSDKQEFVYKLLVKNNQNKKVKMVLKDQYPISSQKEIEVELLKETTTPTFNNEEVGVLSWEFELNPGETKEFRTAYTVKSPKGRNINL